MNLVVYKMTYGLGVNSFWDFFFGGGRAEDFYFDIEMKMFSYIPIWCKIIRVLGGEVLYMQRLGWA